MSLKDKIDVDEDRENNELQITVETTGTGRAVADGLIHHVEGILGRER